MQIYFFLLFSSSNMAAGEHSILCKHLLNFQGPLKTPKINRDKGEIFSIVIFPQGLFIFILHVLRNGDVNAEFDRKIQKWKTSRSIASSRGTHQHSSDMWTNKVINSDTFELNNKRNETISSGFDNPLVLRQQRSITPVDA